MSEKFCIDANVFMTAWYVSYPPHIFSSLWDQISKCNGDIFFVNPVYNEIEPMSSSDLRLPLDQKLRKYPLRMWLKSIGFTVQNIPPEVERLSLDLERDYQIRNNSKGANQIDITLIAYAKEMEKTIVTLEGNQTDTPKEKYNYKVPLICKTEGVECINFVELLEELTVKI